MKKLSDEQIRELAEQAGFWCLDSEWENMIKKLRKLIDLIPMETKRWKPNAIIGRRSDLE